MSPTTSPSNTNALQLTLVSRFRRSRYKAKAVGRSNDSSVRRYVISISYGWAELAQCDVTFETCDKLGYNSTQYVNRAEVDFQKLAARGVSILVSDGDDGAPLGYHKRVGVPFIDVLPCSPMKLPEIVGAAIYRRLSASRYSMSADAFTAPGMYI